MTYVVLYYVQEQELRSKGRMLAMVYMACLPLSAIYIYYIGATRVSRSRFKFYSIGR